MGLFNVFAGFNLGHNEPYRFKKHVSVLAVSLCPEHYGKIIQWTQVEKIKPLNPS